jgi:hypothetical protein
MHYNFKGIQAVKIDFLGVKIKKSGVQKADKKND